jgi:hypothetical protein
MDIALVRRTGAWLLIAAACLSAGCAATRPATNAAALAAPPRRFSPYIVKAVEMLANDPTRAGRGYGSAAFTKELDFGKDEKLKATNEPKTMCVAAQLEVLVEALNIYARETQDYSPFKFLPKSSWERLRPTDLRGQIWIVDGAPSSGASDAFKNNGMGVKVTFEQLKPGDFVNLNRASGSGHGVIFMNYLDLAGNTLDAYSANVAGFRYFSSQGKPDDGGLGYRYAFFYPNCPNNLGDGKRVDCKVIRSASQRLLNTGYVAMPADWHKADPGALSLAPEGTFDSGYFTGETEQ